MQLKFLKPLEETANDGEQSAISAPTSVVASPEIPRRRLGGGGRGDREGEVPISYGDTCRIVAKKIRRGKGSVFNAVFCIDLWSFFSPLSYFCTEISCFLFDFRIGHNFVGGDQILGNKFTIRNLKSKIPERVQYKVRMHLIYILDPKPILYEFESWEEKSRMAMKFGSSRCCITVVRSCREMYGYFL